MQPRFPPPPPLPPGPTAGTENLSPAERGQLLLDKIEQSMGSSRGLISDAAKTASDFGQLLIKTCTTLNSGGLLLVPALLKVFSPEHALPNRGLLLASGLFGLGVGLAATAAVVAFVTVVVSARRVSRTLMLPLLEAQARLFPDAMDGAANKRLEKSRRAAVKLEPAMDRGLIAAAALCSLSTFCFISGGLEAARLVAHIVSTAR